jgi:hypothetical protein
MKVVSMKYFPVNLTLRLPNYLEQTSGSSSDKQTCGSSSNKQTSSSSSDKQTSSSSSNKQTSSSSSDKQTGGSSPNKRIDADVDTELPPTKRSKGSLTRLEELQMENNRLKKQIEKYRNEWMRMYACFLNIYVEISSITARPTDAAVINYFVRVGELFSSNGIDDDKKSDTLERVCATLDMQETDLNRLKKPNGTKTARAVVRACYPASTRAGITADQIDPEFREAIHGNRVAGLLNSKNMFVF